MREKYKREGTIEKTKLHLRNRSSGNHYDDIMLELCMQPLNDSLLRAKEEEQERLLKTGETKKRDARDASKMNGYAFDSQPAISKRIFRSLLASTSALK